MYNTHPKSEGMWVGRFEIRWNPEFSLFQALDSNRRVHYEDAVGKKVHDWAVDQIRKEEEEHDKTRNASSSETQEQA